MDPDRRSSRSIAATDHLGVPATLLRPPISSVEPILRTRLVERLTALRLGDIGLVVAPAGSGKTTLLSQAYQAFGAQGIDVVWLSITPLADELHRFCIQLIAAVRRVRPGFAGDLPMWLEESAANQHQELVLRFAMAFSQLEGRRLVLFLDDYHEVGSDHIASLMAALIPYLPPDFSLVIGSRVEPRLPIASLRAGNRLVELGWEELHFSRAEAEQFLSRDGIDIRTSRFDSVYEQTEGWPAGLQLASISLASGTAEAAAVPFSGSRRAIADYLLDVVFRQLPVDLQQFLLQTSILDRLSAPLCDALRERSDSRDILDELERRNLFTFRLDENRLWYRYHHLFAEFLQARLRERQPDLAAQLYAAASRWYEAQEAYHEAVDYALRGGHLERAALLLEPYGRRLFEAGRFKELRLSLGQLAEPVLTGHPVLCILHGWSYAYTGEFGYARLRAEDAERAADQAPEADVVRAEVAVLRGTLGVIQSDEPDLESIDDDLAARLSGTDASVQGFAHIILGYASRAHGRLDQAGRYFQISVDLTDRSESPLINLLARYNLSVLAWLRGKPDESEKIARSGLLTAQRRYWQDSMGTAFLRVQLATALYEANRLEEALDEFDSAIDTLRATQAFGFLGVAIVSRAMALWAKGMPDKARLDLEQAEEIAANHQVERVRVRMIQLEIRMALAEGRSELARQHLQRGQEMVLQPADARQQPWPEHYEQFKVLEARLLLAEGDWQGALDIAAAVAASAARAERGRNCVEARALSVEALLALGQQQEAVSVLTAVLATAAPSGLWRAFLFIGDRLANLAGELAAGGNELASELMKVLEARSVTGAAEDEQLHIREQQILALVADGLQNRDIGARLFLSEETIKWYLKRLYRRFNVTNRTAAVAKARELGLIPERGRGG